MTLKDLLYTICNNGEESYGTILNTDDESFPEEFRHKGICFSEFYLKIVRSEVEDELFNRRVKSISLQPQTHIIRSEFEGKYDSVDDIFKDYPIRYNTSEGFLIEADDNILVGYANGNDGKGEPIYYNTKNIYHFAAVLKIILETE